MLSTFSDNKMGWLIENGFEILHDNQLAVKILKNGRIKMYFRASKNYGFSDGGFEIWYTDIALYTLDTLKYFEEDLQEAKRLIEEYNEL